MVRLRFARSRLIVAGLAVVAAVFTTSRLSDAGAALAASDSFPHTLTIVAFGSSSTQGVGASGPAAAYPAQLQIMLRAATPRGTTIDVLNRGIGGEDVDDMMQRLDRDVLAAKPDLVIWQTGSNDPLRHVPLARFEAETREGLRILRRAGIAVVLMEPQWCPKLDGTGVVDGYRDAVRRIGAEMGVTVIRRADLMRDWVRSGLLTMTEMVSPDGLHMRDAGYRLLAERVAAIVLHLEAGGPRVTIASAAGI